jgi:hypothetical protein
MIRLPESNLPFFSPFEGNGGMLITHPERTNTPPANFETDAVDWTMRHLLLPALNGHLGKILKLQSVSGSAANDFAAEVLKVATAGDMQYLVTLPIGGIKVAARISTMHDNATFRPLTSAQQGDILVDWGLMSTNFGVTLPAAALDLKIVTQRKAQNPDAREEISKWLCAFLLCEYEITGYRAGVKSHPSWLLPFSMEAPLVLPLYASTWHNLTPSKIRKLAETVDRLARYSISDPRSERDLALHRFSSGAARTSRVDGILDFVIALESLLLPYDEDARRGDLGYRFRLHGAHYLSRVKSERPAIAKQLTDLYSLRSQLVHGGKYPNPNEINTGWDDAKRLARLGLYRAVTEGFPTAAQFKAMLLGT